ncbi:polycystin-1 isoform X2 [Pristis pectinata]|uniref:polycystin-1 isoform X2 n=1 Tax=Pristis pectinata TaxID=685728 RepID=UPI00223D2511|nr:polycystin-1 isoform X2 [Pristis pectinata]
MPYSNVFNQAMQHGVSAPKQFGLCGPVSLCLLSLALCAGVLGRQRECLPCPPNCRCPSIDVSCTVNCSSAGLQRSPRLTELPRNTTVLCSYGALGWGVAGFRSNDIEGSAIYFRGWCVTWKDTCRWIRDLSYNGILSLDENFLDNLTSLEKLYLQGNNISILYKEIFAGRRYLSDIDISNNQISTLEDGIFADLFNLSKINLSFNEFVCDCNLSWLPSWVNEEEANGVIIIDSEFIKCARPSKLKDVSVLSVNFSSLFYGSEFVACLPDRQPIVNLSLVTSQNSSRENCIELCFSEGEPYAVLDNESHCLCGSKLEPDSVSVCTQEAADRGFIQVCGCTIIEQAFKATIANFAEPRTFSLFEAARLTVKTLVNVSTFQWDFGDLSPPFNTTSHAVFHKYGLPGTYLVSVAFFVGRKLTSLHVEINVTIPPGRLEMMCPLVVQTNKSIDVRIYNWNSNGVTASWSVTASNIDTVGGSPFCPLGGHLSNNYCYVLVTNNSTWYMARQFCQSHSDGDLATVKSPEIQDFIANITGCEHPVWIGLSDTASAGTLQWVDGSTLEKFQDRLPWEPNTPVGDTCVLMNASHEGEWQTDLCTTRRSFVCEYRAGERIPGADYLLVGLPAFSTHLPVRNITVNNNAPPSVGLGELMVFPGLWFSHKGNISVVEMATQDLNHTVHVRFRIYRPRCAGTDLYLVTPDSEEVCTSFALCLARARGNVTHGCVSGTKWCSTAEACLPPKRPCSSDILMQCPNLKPPHFSRSHPSYDIVSETTWTVPAGSSTHYVVLLGKEGIEVQANDIIAIQHNSEPGTFLQCQRNESSPWQQSYFSIVYSSGSADFRSNLTNINWTDGVVCNLRLLYSHRHETVASSPLLHKGQPSPGNYTYQATIENGSSHSNLSCTVEVIAPVTDFSVIYPPKQNGVHYVPKHRPVIVIKVKSSDRPSASWSGSNQTFSCETTCPADLSPVCGKESNGTCYSQIPLVVKDCNLTSIVITVRNKVSSVNKTVAVRAEDLIEGLTIVPDPKVRVLSNTLVTYTARVNAGTNVMFKWTVDDKASFIHYNQVYKVIYRTEAVYKLSLTASNHVSSQSIICNVTVDRRNPLAELNVSGVPVVLVQGVPYMFIAGVKVDAAINATFRWCFGDGTSDVVYQFSSPYNLSLSVPYLTVKQAVLQHNVTHVYRHPGEYNLSVSASDKYDNLSQLFPLRVYSRLSNISINVNSDVIATGKRAEFEASLLPSGVAATYSWSFGDNSSQLIGNLQRVTHTFSKAGRYNISVQASNAISNVSAHCMVEVLEEISDVDFSDNSPTELSAPTIVKAWVRTGTRVRWTFDMGDGTPLTETFSSVMNYTYSAVGNYTVTVVASNLLGSANASRLVEVFVLQVCRINPAGCVQELLETNFTAYTPGDSANYEFFWDFGDGSSNETISGKPNISHNYTRSGDFPLYLVVSSSVNKVNYYSNVCVQPAVSKVVVTPANSFIQLGEEGTFIAEAFPVSQYTYLWDFGAGVDPQFRGKEANYTFGSSGLHWVNVTAFNNVSWASGAAWAQVQTPLMRLEIHLQGGLADNLVRGQPYTFRAASDGDSVCYTWDFGDGGGNGTGANVTRSFRAAGGFRVGLEGKNMVSSLLAEMEVVVKAPLRGLAVEADASATPVNASVLFRASLQDGDSARYLWTFCRGCQPLEGPPCMNHTFAAPGVFNVTVRAENGVSSAQASVQIHVLEEIEGLAMVLGDLAQNCCLFANQTLWFQATIRFGTEISYDWTIWKAATVFFHTTEISSQALFEEAGSYEIVLQASNLLGTVNVSELVAVLEPIGNVALRASPEPVAVNETTVIDVCLDSGTDVIYSWALDTSTVVSTHVPSVQHRFQSPGVKRVNVTATNRLSSGRATLAVRVQEQVGGVDIAAQRYAATNTTVSFRALALRGTNISWQWTLPRATERDSAQEITELFPFAGVYPIRLNASNDVSWELALMNITVQDEIQGLQLLASSWAVAPGQTVVFTVLLSAGTDVSFHLGINDTFMKLHNITEYTYRFTHLGTYQVTLTAQNRVSCSHADMEIRVIEPVQGLRLVNCDEQAVPAGVTKTFRAEVSSGFQVSYLWHFALGSHSDLIAGQNVSYTPKVRGHLSVLLRASNNISSENVSALILVQCRILAARLTASPPISVVNESVHLSLSVTPSFTEATFVWRFGDGSQVHANMSVLSHFYLQPGVYLVEVNASNYVSFYAAQATVTILVLKCDPPKVSMILSDTMRRSQRNYLEADIDLQGCTEYQVGYRWEIHNVSSCTSLEEGNEVQPRNVDLKRPRLQLPTLSLAVGWYCVLFTISFEGTSFIKTVQSIVNVIPSALVPIIDGGTFRSWTTMQDLVMDGTRSYDPDQPPERQTPLDFKWLCTYPCLGPSGCGISGNGAIFSISREKLKHNTNYTCCLNVSKPDRESQSVKQLISVKGGSSPLVSLECVSCKAQAVYGVSKSSYVYLSGSCSNCEGTPQYVWKVENSKKELLALNNATTSTGSNGMNLVLRHGVLEDGDGYTFSLNVTDPLMENVGFASIYIPPIHLPSGGSCLIFPTENISALTTSVTFTCTGWETAGIPLVYTFILTRCGVGGKHCDEFYVYRGSRSEYCAVLPPGFSSNRFNAYLAVTVQNQQGASVVALNRSVVINITSTPEGFQSLTDWMKLETETKLQELLKQGDPQPTVEYALALVTVLNEYERSKSYGRESTNETISRINIRSNITLALTSLKVTTVDDIQQISAALAQCTVISREFICGECQKETLSALDNMITVLQKETGQGKMTPTSIGDNILVTVGGLIDITNQLVPVVNKVNRPLTSKPELVATKAYDLSMKLMQILMGTRVLNEEPLSVSGARMRAQGKRADPGHLLCFANKSGCQFSIPPSFNSIFSNISDVTQVMFLVDSNPFPYGYIKNYTISSKVASIEFKMDNGSQIPIESLDSEKAITVTVSANSEVRNVTINTTVITARKSVMVNITSRNLNKRAGLHIQVTYTVLNDSGTCVEKEAEPFIQVLLHNSTKPNEHNYKAKKRIYLESVGGSDHKLYTFFLSPDTEDTRKDYYLNITNYYTSCSVQVSVGVYTSLCQYFNMTAMSWKTDGILPLEDTTPDIAVCLTQHLTAFGASLFVPPNSVVFINPPSSVIKNYIVLITCGICFAIYAVSAIIVRKLDRIDIGRVGVIPLCGKDGFYKYEILVKTGWGRGTGTSSHVGISLYGREDKSGHRHLDNEGAFHRNSVDIFQIATDNSLGNIWKIHVWHDNKGLTPSWYLQHVIIKDLQTNNTYYFLVNDWLAVNKDGNEGRVEKEVLAASEAKLKDFSRIFTAEIQRGFSEGHIWLSIWDRPPRSCFTRVQRVTCCLVLVHLCFCATAVWYGVISHRSISDLPISALVPLSGESVAAGIVSSIIIYPIYLILILLFRKSRSRAAMSDSGPHESNVLEIDDYVDPSIAGSSFLTFADNLEEDYKEKLKTDVNAKSLPNWPAYNSVMNWPDLLSDQSIIGSNIPKLRRGRGTRHLGIETQLSSDDEPLSLGYEQARAKALSASDEHLIQRMSFAGNNEVSTSHDSGRVSLDVESHLISNLTEIISGNEELPTEAAILHKTSDFGHIIRPTQGIGRLATTRRIAFSDPPQRCLFPFWCSYTAHTLCFLLFSVSITVSLWIGVSFTPRVALMWLISGIFSVLSSFFLLEPLKVLTEALYFSLVAKRVHPDEDDNLVEKPRVEQISERIGKVRPPQGYGLLQAREEAKKVQILHRMLKNFIIYMLFLLVVLLINYGDSFRDAQSRLLHSSIRQGLVGVRKGVEFQKIKRSGELFKWMAEALLPYLYNNRSKTLLGCARLRQVRSKINHVQCLQQAPPSPVTRQCLHYPMLQDTSDYEIGWKSPVTNRNNTWSYSSPDLPEVWYWGQTTTSDSGGYVQKLGRTMDQSNYTLWHLQESNWLDRKTRVVFVEFAQYCPNVDLYSVVTVLVEFPISGGAFTAIDIKPFSLLRLSAGVDFLLVMMVFLLLFILYFTISELLLMRHEGRTYFFQFWNYLQWSVIILSVCCVAVHLKRAKIGDKQWAHYLANQDCFTNFYQLAYLSQVFTNLAAILLFLLMVKAARQLRFVRKWSIFGKTLHNSGKELFAVVVTSAVPLLAYTQLGYLFFSANLDNFKTFGGSVLSLFTVIQRGISLRQCFFEYPSLCSIYYISYIVIEIWIVLRLFAAVLIQNYRVMKLEMHRPAVEPQEYELVELFVRRLKMWIGVSKAKEFRHKVKFEGMVPLPSRSSRDSKSTCLHTASTISDISSSSTSSESTPTDAFPLASPNKAAQIEMNIHRLVPLFEALLEQFDKVNNVTEDIYQVECKLKHAQDRMQQRKINTKAEELVAAYRRMRASRRLRDDCRSSLPTPGDKARIKDTQLGNSPLEDCTMEILKGKEPQPPRRKSKMPDNKMRQQTPGDHPVHSNPD